MSAATETPLFAPRVGVWLTLFGVAAFVGLAVFASFGARVDAPGGVAAGSALSRSAVGFAGLAELLRARGVAVVIDRGRTPPRSNGPPGLMILTPGPETAATAVDQVHARRAVLIVLPKWITTPDPQHRGWVRSGGVLPPTSIAAPLRHGALRAITRQGSRVDAVVAGAGFPFLPPARFPLGRIDALQSVTPQAGDVLLADDAGRAVLFVLDGTTYVLTDPDLLNNQGLLTLARARLALEIVDALRDDGPVVFDATLNGAPPAQSLLRLALTPPFLGATLCAAAAAGLAGWRASARFGAPIVASRAIALGKASLVENTAVLIRLARREPSIAPKYAALTRRAIARALAQGDAPTAALDAWLDRLPGDTGAFSTLVTDAGRVRDATGLMDVARRLHRRRLEITLERL